MKKSILTGVMAAVLLITAVLTPAEVYGDRVDDKPYLALGADLTEEQKASVLALLDVDPAQLDEYTVYEVTNEEEYEHLGSYLDASVIGSKSLSSVKVIGREDGYGIQVRTENISYCTVGMYQNALATAGMENAEVVVAGPFALSGTAALVGAMKAYEAMTGDVIDPELMDGAANELVVTSELGDSIGDTQKAEDLISAIKEIISANEFNSEGEIDQAINDVAADLDIQLSDEDRAMIRDLVDKLSKLDLDFETIKEQAGDLYDRISNMDLSKYGITEENVEGFLGKLSVFFSELLEKIKGLFE